MRLPQVVAQIARDGFAEADAYEQQAAELPRWRWLKRHNLHVKADVTRKAMTLFVRDAKLEAAFSRWLS